jgi:DNA damage-binding protein 1
MDVFHVSETMYVWGGGWGCCSLAICKKGELTIGKFDDIQKLHIRTVPLGEQPRRISHQEKSHTFAICSAKYSCSSDMEIHYVHLISDQTFEIMSSYELRSYEEACSIISCSFSCDVNVYYCVGTAFVLPEDSEPSKVYPIPIWKFLIQFVVYC